LARFLFQFEPAMRQKRRDRYDVPVLEHEIKHLTAKTGTPAGFSAVVTFS
jgi:hypothetical protein